jgi:hypothetical protein
MNKNVSHKSVQASLVSLLSNYTYPEEGGITVDGSDERRPRGTCGQQMSGTAANQ